MLFRGAFLADPVGLGKSYTALYAALRVKHEKGLRGFILVCCPKQCVPQWYDEVVRHFDPVSFPASEYIQCLTRLYRQLDPK